MTRRHDNPESEGGGEAADDIPASVDMRAIADILRRTYPDMPAEEILAHIVRILDDKGP